MGPFTTFLATYLLGGLTFIPLLLLSLLIHFHLTCPTAASVSPQSEQSLLDPSGDAAAAAKGPDDRFHSTKENDVAAGYFAVCREYVPGGVNGKPPERTTPLGAMNVVAAPSPSVYQSMYRSLFERKGAGGAGVGPGGPLENKTAGNRKGGNVFYVVLRHSHLVLFDDSEMLEVRYVLSLAHHDISIYGGGEHIPDGELFIKRNAICLTRKTDAGEMTADGVVSKPFFLFSENTSEKEDFYFAMLKNQDRTPNGLNNPPVPLQFEVKDMIGLVQRLHSSEEYMQTRWINALIGRVFLGLYKTSEVEDFVRAKITKKISRVKKPSFLSGIVLRDIYMGEGAPFITNPRLKELNVDGDCVVEADVRYTGNFRLEIAATARIDLGTRFKAREVDLLLAVVLKRIEGHVLVRIKPPPSNRVWMTFSQPPKIEMTIEPIVSARHITYTLILRQIENRIKEVVAESIVMPNWDDVTFYSTEDKKWRGGVWVEKKANHTPHDLETAATEGDVDEVEHMEAETSATLPMEKSMSVPVLESPSAYPRKTARSLFNMSMSKAAASSSSLDTSKSFSSDKPRALRHGSFASSIVGMDVTNIDAVKATTPPEHSHASPAMAAISALSHPGSPAETPLEPSVFGRAGSDSEGSSLGPSSIDASNAEALPNLQSENMPRSDASSLADSSSLGEFFSQNDSKRVEETLETTPGSPHDHSPESNFTKSFLNHSRRHDTNSSGRSTDDSDIPSTPPKRINLAAVANAAATARRWGLHALQRSGDHSKDGSHDSDDTSPHLTQPMGRGRPLPPPGTPLPPPSRKTPTAPIPVPKRKPLLAPPALPKRPAQRDPQTPVTSTTRRSSVAPGSPSPSSTGTYGWSAGDAGDGAADSQAPPLPKRWNQRNGTSRHLREDGQDWGDEGVFVVAAPVVESEPTTPLAGEAREGNYMQPWVDDEVDEDER